MSQQRRRIFLLRETITEIKTENRIQKPKTEPKFFMKTRTEPKPNIGKPNRTETGKSTNRPTTTNNIHNNFSYW